MSGSILALFGVCLGTAFLEFLMPGEEKKGPRQVLHVLAALVALLLILRPTIALVGDGEAFFKDGDAWLGEGEEIEVDYQQVFSDAVTCRSAAELTARLYDWLDDEFALTGEECLVTVTLDGSGDLARIQVRLQKSGLLQDPEAVEHKLKEMFTCEVEVR